MRTSTCETLFSRGFPLGLAALVEAAAPYGIESFDEVLKPLWLGIRLHRGKGLAVFLKAIGFIIPVTIPGKYISKL